VSPESASTPDLAWGRVDDDGTVSVREVSAEDGTDTWRVVGQYPDGTPDEALAYFARKFTDLADKVRLLEQRQRGGGASASDLTTTAKHLLAEIDGAAAVGNLANLKGRVEALLETLSAATATEAAAAKEAVTAAVVERTELVVKAEALAARDPKSVQWKQATQELNDLFEAWQTHQQNGPRLPKRESQDLWKRFRDARATVEKHRREFFAELDETHKGARDRKARLVERAEALLPKGEDGIPLYRALLDEWKAAGRAGKKVDDSLWAKFKAAGDALYATRAEKEAAEIAQSEPKIEAKQALLVEAAAVADERDLTAARSLLASIQRRWDEIGRVSPRERDRSLDDGMRKIEQALKAREEVDWKRNNPETKARAGDMARQLADAIEKLEAELAAATAKGDASATKRISADLETRRAWLKVVDG
jgi:hypothetical protein